MATALSPPIKVEPFLVNTIDESRGLFTVDVTLFSTSTTMPFIVAPDGMLEKSNPVAVK